jgi:hypothetical protein
MFPTTTLSPLSPEAHAALLADYDHTADPESRTRYQMVLLRVERDLSPRQIAPLVLRSHDTVLRVLQRYQARGRAAIVLLDNAKIHTPQGAKVVREAVERHGDNLRLVPTPPYDPLANPAELLFRPLRRGLTHNNRDNVVEFFRDAFRYFEGLDAAPDRALRHIGSPFPIRDDSRTLIA